MMKEAIQLVFYNQGLRSYIEVDLCARCPRQDDKGCCGYYSPVFYNSDLAWMLEQAPELVRELFSMEHLTIMDASVTVNQLVDGDSYLCRFHSREGGCRLPQHLRESVCRHFVCSGIDWQQEADLVEWKYFFDQLTDYEIALNQAIADRIAALGLSLRNHQQREIIFSLLPGIFKEESSNCPAFFASVPPEQKYIVYRHLTDRETWTL